MLLVVCVFMQCSRARTRTSCYKFIYHAVHVIQNTNFLKSATLVMILHETVFFVLYYEQIHKMFTSIIAVEIAEFGFSLKPPITLDVFFDIVVIVADAAICFFFVSMN